MFENTHVICVFAAIRPFIWRRSRRIVPALVTVLIATLGIALCVLTGPELKSLARHLIAGSLSASNLLLWSEVGYFDTTAALKPLLHLWSLGVEEQFYFLWPLFLGALPLVQSALEMVALDQIIPVLADREAARASLAG